MIAWWSCTFLSLTTRSRGRLSSEVTYSAAFAYCALWPDQLGRGLDLGDHVTGQVARAGTRVGERLVLLVEALRGGERPARREAVHRVGVALERGEVVEELRALRLLLLLQLRDLALVALNGGDHGGGLVLGRQAAPAQVAADVAPLARGLELRLDQPVGLRLERADLLLALGDEGERGRLDATERHGAVERGPQANRRGARGVHAHQPVGLGARARRVLERLHLGAGAQARERLGDRAFRHRRQPEAVHRLVHAGGLEHVGEDELALAPGVAGVHDALYLGILHQLVDRLQLLRGPVVDRHQLEVLGHDREVRVAPLAQLRVVRVRLGEPHQMAHRPGDHELVAHQMGLVLRLRIGARQRRRDIAGDGGLLGYDERLGHRSPSPR